jgi:uncharacterized phage protein (TIGR01671 family)
MNREIKFRAWTNNTFIEKGMLYDYQDTTYVEIFGFNDENLPLMQYTGLKDKNGVYIYEGDILKVGENLIAEIIYIGQNIEDYGDEIHCSFHAKIKSNRMEEKIIPIDSYFRANCNVIGNLHEAPELLNN